MNPKNAPTTTYNQYKTVKHLAILLVMLAMLPNIALTSNSIKNIEGKALSPEAKKAKDLVENIQLAPSNPDVTCLRASVALKMATKKLNQAKHNLKVSLSSNYKIEESKSIFEKC